MIKYIELDLTQPSELGWNGSNPTQANIFSPLSLSFGWGWTNLAIRAGLE